MSDKQFQNVKDMFRKDPDLRDLIKKHDKLESDLQAGCKRNKIIADNSNPSEEKTFDLVQPLFVAGIKLTSVRNEIIKIAAQKI